jgi:hypothetical protein
MTGEAERRTTCGEAPRAHSIRDRRTIAPIDLSRIAVDTNPLAFIEKEAGNGSPDVDCLAATSRHEGHEGKEP